MSPARTAPVAVIVDGYATANFYPEAFGRLGVDLVHVQSTDPLLPGMISPDLSRYRGSLVCAGPDHLERTLGALRDLQPIAVLAGQEPGVPLADLLSERLGVATNGSALSTARRDKFAMIEALRTAGLHCASQFRSADPAAIVAWAERHGSFPVVVKPLRSSSSDNVFVCENPEQVGDAARTVLAGHDMYGGANSEALVQSYLVGTEYIVDTVSADGSVYVCGVWRYIKHMLPRGRRIYDRDELLDSETEPVPELIRYVEQVLPALGIRHGPVHAEVIVTPEGPALVEMGARLNGNMDAGFHDVCLGGNQADLNALAYADRRRFAAEYGGRRYGIRQPAVVHNTAGDRGGVVSAVDQGVVDRIAALPAVHLVTVRLRPGQRMRPTDDLMSSPLKIFLTHPDRDRLESDYRSIQVLKDRVYQLA